MRTFAGIIGFLVFLALFAGAAGDYIDGIKTKAKANCIERAKQGLGLCAK